ncbi:MAG: branched-chain amino acid ABC transporter permease [Candidatus Bipolaricaulota bacterium]
MFHLRVAGRYLQSELFALPTRMLALLFIIGLLAFPLFSQHPYVLRVLILTAIFTMYAVSWDVLAGYAGQISLGHALFFGVGAYTVALLNTRVGLPPVLSIPLGALAAMAAGLLVGVPCLRLRKYYLALATLAFPLMLTGVVYMFPRYTGGELGIFGISRLAATPLTEYYIATGSMLAIVLGLWKLTTSRIGLIFHAIREDEVVVRALGINSVRYKLLAFIVSGLVAGLSGALYAHFDRIAGPSNLELFMSFQPVIWTIFGGAATIYGPVTGVFILYPALESLRALPEYRMLIFALLVLLVLRFMPSGLAPWVRERAEKECPHCKVKNAFLRSSCRTCRTELSP